MSKDAPLSEEPPMEARAAFRLAFMGIGGVPKLIAWAKTHRTLFYQTYAKLIPLQIAGEVTAKVEVDVAGVALEKILTRLIAQRRAEEAAAVVTVDVTPDYPDRAMLASPSSEPVASPPAEQQLQQPPAPSTPALAVDNTKRAEPAPLTREQLEERRELALKQARERAMQPSFPTPVSTEPTSTQLYYEHGCGDGFWANLPGRLP
jgi:hypothetical protein